MFDILPYTHAISTSLGPYHAVLSTTVDGNETKKRFEYHFERAPLNVYIKGGDRISGNPLLLEVVAEDPELNTDKSYGVEIYIECFDVANETTCLDANGDAIIIERERS